MSYAKALYKKYPSEQFWEKFYLPFKIISLIWFLGERGKRYVLLERKKQKLSFKKEEPAKLRKTKVGKDPKTKPREKNLLEFIENGKTKKNK
tara:strand:+ start:251 stop:526 length:276 start_codon:yes stop_codon:yes gene_type:complete